MEGIILVAGLIAGVTLFGIKARSPADRPGVGLVLVILVASGVYLFA